MNYWLTFIGCFLVNCASCFAQDHQQFGVQAATISYVHSGSTYGTSTLYFDDFGIKKANQTVLRADSANGKILTQYNEVFINNERLFENSPRTNKNRTTAGISLSSSIISTAFTAEMLNSLDFFENGKCIVAGKECVKYGSSTDTICLWNGIVLKAVMHLSVVSINIEAVRIDLKPPPGSVFQNVTENINH